MILIISIFRALFTAVFIFMFWPLLLADQYNINVDLAGGLNLLWIILLCLIAYILDNRS